MSSLKRFEEEYEYEYRRAEYEYRCAEYEYRVAEHENCCGE